MARAIGDTSFDLCEFAAGKPMTVYVELPVFQFGASRPLTDLWVNALLLLGCAGRGAARPPARPLFIIDSPFAFNFFPALAPIQAGDVADLWTRWESLEQLRARHPADWSAFLARAARVEAIGPVNPVLAAELAPLFSCPRDELQALLSGSSMVLYERPNM